MATPSVAIYCVGCGVDLSQLSSRDRRNLNSDSTGDPVLRKQALSGWRFLLCKKLQQQGISIDDITYDLENPGKMCKHCFTEFKKYQNLQVELEGRLSVALQCIELGLEGSTTEATDAAASSSCLTPPSKRRCARSSSFPLSTSASPPVTVRAIAMTVTSSTAINFFKLSIYVQINVGYKSAPKNYYLCTPRRKHMGKSIARGSRKTLIDQCYSDPQTLPLMLKKIGRVVRAEVKKMCSEKTASVLRSGSYTV